MFLREQKLWDTDVMATFAVIYDKPGSTATPRDARFELVEARPLAEDQLFDA